MKLNHFTLLVFSVLLIMGIILSCKTGRSFPTKFFEKKTSCPISIIDSIKTADTLNFSSNYVKDWNKSMYVTSDSVVTFQYVLVTSKKDTTFIISVTEVEGDSINLIKFRKE